MSISLLVEFKAVYPDSFVRLHVGLQSVSAVRLSGL